MAAAGPKDAVHGRPVAPQTGRRDKGLDRAGEAAPLHPPGPAAALQDMLAEGQRHRKVLVGGVGAAVNVLAEGEGIVAALPHQRQERIEAARPQGAVFGQGAGVFPEKVGRPQAGAVPALGPQGGQAGPEVGLPHLAQHFAAVKAGGHRLHLAADGGKLGGQFAVAAPGVGDAQAHPRRQQPFGVDLFHPRGLGVLEVGKDHPAQGAGQLVQHAAGLAEIDVLGVLAQTGYLGRRQAAAELAVHDGAHPHLKGRRAGQPRAPQHIAGGVGVVAAHFPARRAEPFGQAPDQAGRVGELPALQVGLVQVHHVQLVEAPGLDPYVMVVVLGGYRHQVQPHRRRQAVAVLVVGVVAPQLGPAGGGVDPHLPPRPKVQLEPVQRRAPARPLAGQRLFG